MTVFWIAALAGFCLAEAATAALVSIWFAAGAAGALLAAAFGAGLSVQLAVFLILSALTLLALRPLMRRTVHIVPTNADRLLHRTATVLEPVGADGGAVRIDGKVWSARCEEDGAELPRGAEAEILRIEGVKLMVRPIGKEAAENLVPSETK